MADPTPTEIRFTIINADNDDVLSDTVVNMFLADAKTLQNSTDSTALRYYTCYVIATNWGNIDGISSFEGITYRVPDPDKFFKLYNQRMAIVNQTANSGVLMAKVSTNVNSTYDDGTKAMRYKTSAERRTRPY